MARRLERALAYLVLIAFAIVGLAPFLYLLLLSTKRTIQVFQVPPTLDIDWNVVAKNYHEVLYQRGFIQFGVNSVIVTFFAVLVAVLIGTPAAYTFSRLKFRGKDRWASTILSFRFMPPIAVAIPILLMIRAVDLTDTYLGLVLPYVAFTLPLTVWILIGFFDEIPRELDDAALVDGCSRLGTLVRVTGPLVRPGIMVAAIFGAVGVWNEYLVGVFLINSERMKTMALGAGGLLSAQRPIEWNVAATVGVVTIIPIFIFSLFAQRYIVRGVTAGAVR